MIPFLKCSPKKSLSRTLYDGSFKISSSTSLHSTLLHLSSVPTNVGLPWDFTLYFFPDSYPLNVTSGVIKSCLVTIGNP